jgi:hypothetical protein
MSFICTEARARKGALLGLLILVGRFAYASDPASPIQLLPVPNTFRANVSLSQMSPLDVRSFLVMNRIAGALVDPRATSVDGVPVRRPLTLQPDGQGGFFLNASPTGSGVPPLADGVYSHFVEVVYTPPPQARGRRPFRERAHVWYRVQSGRVEHLSAQAYSALVEPTVSDTNKLGRAEPTHVGLVGLGPQRKPVTGNDSRIESGAPFMRPGQPLEND